MAEVEIPVTTLGDEPVSVTWVDASVDGNYFRNATGTQLWMEIVIGSGDRTLTLISQRDCTHEHGASAGQLIDKVIGPLAHDQTHIIGYFDRRHYNDESNECHLTVDDAVGVRFAAILMPLERH